MTKAIQSRIVGTTSRPQYTQERAKLQADLALDQDGDDPGQRDGQRRSPARDHRQRDAPCPAGSSRSGSARPGRSPPAGSIAPARATRPCRTAGAGRVQVVESPIAPTANPAGVTRRRRVEEADVDQRGAHRLQQQERDEQIEPGAGAQLGQLAHGPRARRRPAGRADAWSSPARPAGPAPSTRPATAPSERLAVLRGPSRPAARLRRGRLSDPRKLAAK